jgi:hypothetical protein
MTCKEEYISSLPPLLNVRTKLKLSLGNLYLSGTYKTNALTESSNHHSVKELH